MCGRHALYAVITLGLVSHGIAGERPQVDLSVTAEVLPTLFVPGGRAGVTLVVHNNGPDTAGATVPGVETIAVFGDAFIITSQPPPFEIRDPVVGCRADEFISEPLPDGNIALIFLFYFEAIAPRESRTCSYDIEFYPFTTSSVPYGWQVYTFNDDDSDHSNDRVDFAFQPAGDRPTAVRALSAFNASALAGFIVLAGLFAGRSGGRRGISQIFSTRPYAGRLPKSSGMKKAAQRRPKPLNHWSG